MMNGNMGPCHRGGLADIFSAAPTGLLSEYNVDLNITDVNCYGIK